MKFVFDGGPSAGVNSPSHRLLGESPDHEAARRHSILSSSLARFCRVTTDHAGWEVRTYSARGAQ